MYRKDAAALEYTFIVFGRQAVLEQRLQRVGVWGSLAPFGTGLQAPLLAARLCKTKQPTINKEWQDSYTSFPA